MGVPSRVYRFLPATQTVTPVAQLEELVRMVDITNALPDMSGWEGRMDMVPASQATGFVQNAVLSTRQETDSSVAFTHYTSPVCINFAEMCAFIERERGGTKGLENMPGLKWIGKIKRMGWGWFLTSQQAVVGAEGEGKNKGKGMESRR
ncbi:MAG: hypothetical protein L6R35_007500 [Caloplaca aegaea]|nr:MAG: hypothetical protein L6R35_007500 [Caloplaca aegaea]